jgi:hypothetical protein
MLSYDDLAEGLEEAWVAARLHDHELFESIQPESLDRTYKAVLLPNHPEPLNDENMPPWVEVGFTWSAEHQACSSGRSRQSTPSDPLDITWVYNVMVRGVLRERRDQELVHLFQHAVQAALTHFYPSEAPSMPPIPVEVRRIYQSDENRAILVHVHLVSSNITDLSEQWEEQNPLALGHLLRSEFAIASTVIQALREIFNSPSGGDDNNYTYHSVDTA